MQQPANKKNNSRGNERIDEIRLRPYNLKELAVIYGVCRKTLVKWLSPFADEIGKRIGYIYNIRQVKIIFARLDLPGEIMDDR